MKDKFKEQLKLDTVLEKISGYSMIKSKVCEKEDIKLLKGWLGFRPRKLKLLYRVSEDGDKAATFREKVKN